MKEKEVFQAITNKINLISEKKNKPIRVAINGIEGTGKTFFADRLCQYLKGREKKALHVSIDGFHFNKEHRYRQGRDSAKGYYEDSYDEKSFVEKVLILSQKEKSQIITAMHDLDTDAYINPNPLEISNDTILITDGAYLFKPVYREHWDLKIYLKTDFQTALQRGVKRDENLLGGFEAAKEKFEKRYHLASKIYNEDNNPLEVADIIIDNTNLDDLKIEKFCNN